MPRSLKDIISDLREYGFSEATLIPKPRSRRDRTSYFSPEVCSVVLDDGSAAGKVINNCEYSRYEYRILFDGPHPIASLTLEYPVITLPIETTLKIRQIIQYGDSSELPAFVSIEYGDEHYPYKPTIERMEIPFDTLDLSIDKKEGWSFHQLYMSQHGCLDEFYMVEGNSIYVMNPLNTVEAAGDKLECLRVIDFAFNTVEHAERRDYSRLRNEFRSELNKYFNLDLALNRKSYTRREPSYVDGQTIATYPLLERDTKMYTLSSLLVNVIEKPGKQYTQLLYTTLRAAPASVSYYLPRLIYKLTSSNFIYFRESNFEERLDRLSIILNFDTNVSDRIFHTMTPLEYTLYGLSNKYIADVDYDSEQRQFRFGFLDNSTYCKYREFIKECIRRMAWVSTKWYSRSHLLVDDDLSEIYSSLDKFMATRDQIPQAITSSCNSSASSLLSQLFKKRQSLQLTHGKNDRVTELPTDHSVLAISASDVSTHPTIHLTMTNGQGVDVMSVKLSETLNAANEFTGIMNPAILERMKSLGEPTLGKLAAARGVSYDDFFAEYMSACKQSATFDLVFHEGTLVAFSSYEHQQIHDTRNCIHVLFACADASFSAQFPGIMTAIEVFPLIVSSKLNVGRDLTVWTRTLNHSSYMQVAGVPEHYPKTECIDDEVRAHLIQENQPGVRCDETTGHIMQVLHPLAGPVVRSDGRQRRDQHGFFRSQDNALQVYKTIYKRDDYALVVSFDMNEVNTAYFEHKLRAVLGDAVYAQWLSTGLSAGTHSSAAGHVPPARL